MKKSKQQISDAKAAIFLGLIFILIVSAITSVWNWKHFVRGTTRATVVKTERVPYGNGVSKYMVYTDKGVFENTDSWLEFKVNSADVYGAIKNDHTYDFRYYGPRWSWLSWFPNIVSVEEVKEVKAEKTDS